MEKNFATFRTVLPIKGIIEAPEPRSGHRIFTDGHHIYLIGGYNQTRDANNTVNFYENDGDDSLFREVWIFNILTHVWKKLGVKGKFPKEMASFAMCPNISFSRFLMFGGTSIPFGISAVNKARIFYVKGPQKFSWHPLKCIGDIPVAGYGQVLLQYDDLTFYLIGGTTGHEYSMQVHSLRLPHPRHIFKANSEQSKSPEAIWTNENATFEGPHPRYRHEAFIVDEHIVVFGGGTRDSVTKFEMLDAFNLVTKTWTHILTIPDETHGYPEGRRCHAAVQFQGKIYIVGGCSGSQTDGVHVYDDLWSCDTCCYTWTKFPTRLSNPVYFHSAAVTPTGCLFVFGGVFGGEQDKKRSATLEQIWLRPPSLAHFCCRLLLKTWPILASYSINRLQLFGFPRNIADLIINDNR